MTNRAVIYRSNSRWQIVTAFTVAIAIHLSAVAIASLRHGASTVNTGDEFATIDVDPGEPPAPLQPEVPVQAAPPSVSPQEFIEPPESQRPTAKRQSIIPIRPIGQTPLGIMVNAKASALSAPRPEYPYEARSRHITGSGIGVMNVDPATGVVEDVTMEQSIGNPILDNAAVSAFRRWRFKKGTPHKVRVPITFNLTGAQF